ncbi:hypothetical protein VVD49_08545 [Uliginosibacterium sp. H3]|uniref:Uncharacterized protein n=1 Tax=Uliginosibacterium silvisoli TaxID=3114758 RepID=A0ABU6K429_9RHOO|nr:hypothetical protein [Uliginosibacterium sp. H3]
MSNRINRISVFLGTAALLALATAPAQAQTPGTSITLAQVHANQADLSSGGKAGVDESQLSFSHTAVIGAGRTLLGVQLGANYENWSFDGVTTKPWKSVQRFSLGVPLIRILDDGWSVLVTPRAEWSGEEGAKSSDSVAWGLIGGVSKQYGEGRRIGFGLTVSRTLDKDNEVFPIILVDWRFNEQWRLFNPLGRGLTSPAGLELAYQLAPAVELGLGASLRNSTFRLADDNLVSAGGVGKASYAPVFLHLNWKPAPAWNLDAYAGMLLNGRLKVEDKNGNKVSSQDLANTPAFGLAASFRF